MIDLTPPPEVRTPSFFRRILEIGVDKGDDLRCSLSADEPGIREDRKVRCGHLQTGVAI